MRRKALFLATAIASGALGGRAFAQGGGHGSAAPRASGAPVTTTAAASADPESPDEEELPAGHPAVGDSEPHAGAHGSSAMPGMFQPPEDSEQPDPTLPPGSIAVELRDADDKPVVNETITLGVLINSIAKGDSRQHQQATTNDRGHVVFSGLEMASNIAYRISCGYQGGAFAASPFQLQQAKAMRVVLHVCIQSPATIQQAVVVTETTIAAEVRDDRIQVEEVFTVYNLGRTAWQPDDVRISLPDGYTAFNAQASMTDQGVDEVAGGAKLRGTFSPGPHPVDFRWQLPWSGDKDVDFQVGLPPHVAIARVMMPATTEIKLTAEGFAPPVVRHDNRGQSFLVTEKRMRPEDAKLTSLGVGIHDLPTPGSGRLLATLLAACGIATGLVLSLGRKSRRLAAGDAKTLRSNILGGLADLERAHLAGDVGPKTYERVRRELIDALARTLVKI